MTVKGRWNDGEGRRRGLAAVGDDLDFAAFAVADAFGADVVAFGEVYMDDAAVGWGHGFEGDAAAGLGDAVGDAVGHFAEGILAALAVLLDVQGDADFLLELLADDALDDELQGLQRVAAAANEEAGVGAGNVDDGAAGGLIVVGAEGNIHFGAGELEDALYGVQGGLRRGGVGGGAGRGRRRGGVGNANAIAGGNANAIAGGNANTIAGGNANTIAGGNANAIAGGIDGVGIGCRRGGVGVRGSGGGGVAGDADFGHFAADAQETLPTLI